MQEFNQLAGESYLCVSFYALLTSLYTSSTLLVTSKGNFWAQAVPTIVDPDCTSLKGARHCMSQVQVISKHSSSKSILSRVSTCYHLSKFRDEAMFMVHEDTSCMQVQPSDTKTPCMVLTMHQDNTERPARPD